MTDSTSELYDIVIIGGGINGCGIARDAAGRGLNVLLVEQDDLAQGTSSASTKLIHGGLRYLEHYEFRLVRAALKEREVLLKIAPHIIWPMRFVLPHNKMLRPAWFIRLGLFIYDHLGGRKILPPTRDVSLQGTELGAPLADGFKKGFEYSDCWVDDARLVVLNARDAADRGATIQTRCRFTAAQRQGQHWQVSLENTRNGDMSRVQSRILVNAAGPWVDTVINRMQSASSPQHNVRLVRGSHVVVPRLYDHDRAYFFQNADGRIMFTIPYEDDFTLMGTTDLDQDSIEEGANCSDAEVRYICESASVYFKQPISPDSVIWTYSGVRPLFDDGASAAQEATRDYILKVDGDRERAPLLNVFGGKITTYRRLAEAALDKLRNFLPVNGQDWTGSAALPGGDFALEDIQSLRQQLQRDYPFLEASVCRRLLRCYGTRAREILGTAQSLSDLGEHFGAGFTEAEIHYLMRHEWAETAEDLLWRRSKMGLHMTAGQRQSVQDWLNATQHNNNAATNEVA